MVFAPFTGFDNHNRCVTFATALILKEDVDSYEWVFKNFKKAMGGVPKTLVTDQDPSMIIVAPKVFPTTRHRFCMWHIMCKVSERVGKTLNSSKLFMEKMEAIVWNEEIEAAEFEQSWNTLIAEYKLEGNQWLKRMFDLRAAWIPAYFTDVLVGGVLKTTSISESQNRFFKYYTDKYISLVELMVHYDNAIDTQRHEHNKMNVEQQANMPDLLTRLPIEKKCAKVFTKFAFEKIQKQIEEGCRVLSYGDSDDMHIFTMKDLERNLEKIYKV